MKKAIFCILTLILFTSCQKEELPRSLRACIKEEIKALKTKPVQNPPAQVWQYKYMGYTVYYIPPTCCDQMSQLYDENCNLICNPDGGFTGNGDGRCRDFFQTRTDGVLVWEDNR